MKISFEYAANLQYETKALYIYLFVTHRMETFCILPGIRKDMKT